MILRNQIYLDERTLILFQTELTTGVLEKPYNTEVMLFKGLRSPHEGLSHARVAGGMWKEERRRVSSFPCLYLYTWPAVPEPRLFRLGSDSV